MTVVAAAAVIEGFFRWCGPHGDSGPGNTVLLDKFGIITSFEDFIIANKRNKDITLSDTEYLRERMTLAQYIGAQSFNGEVPFLTSAMTNVTIKGNTPNIFTLTPRSRTRAAMSTIATTSAAAMSP